MSFNNLKNNFLNNVSTIVQKAIFCCFLLEKLFIMSKIISEGR